MKTSAENSRFVCRITRSWLSVFGGEDAVARSGHVAGCEDCQAFFSLGDELELMLRRDAASQRAVPAAMLEQKILHAVHRSTAPARRSYRTPLFSLVAAVAAVAVGFVALRPAAPVNATLDPVAEGQQVLQDVLKFVPTELFTEMRPQAEAILRQDPLQNELDSVTHSARSAVRFLAKNFLPGEAPLAPARTNG